MAKKDFQVIGLTILAAMILSACSNNSSFNILQRPTKPLEPAVVAEDADTPKMRSGTGKKIANTGNITVAEAAKVSDAELQEAVAKPAKKAERDLGKTIASLGLIDEGGFWLQTPLVKSEVEGRVIYLKSGATVNLQLVPNNEAAGSGSQISIAAMNVLGIPIVELAELQVFIR